MAKRCAKCGRVFPDDHRFCTECGVDLVWTNLVLPAVLSAEETLGRKADEGQVVSASGTGRDYFKEGHAFEVYVANTLFPRPIYGVERITPRRDDLGGRFIASAKDPDLQIRHIKSGHLFWVECKWRTIKSVRNDKLAVLTRAQLERYRSFQEKERQQRVYVVVGLGGHAYAPSRLFCIPIGGFNGHPWPFMKKLTPFERSPSEPFQYWYGQLQ